MAVHRRQKKLAHGRPPISKPRERMTSERSRTIIRTHHRLQKEHAAALKRGDAKAAGELAQAIEKNGGIELYQAASKQGQAADRGGDSSKQLVEWLRQLQILDNPSKDIVAERSALKCLEVGALSTKNEISKLPQTIHMTRIDLNSQGSGIEKQDFMERPLPQTNEERFDIVSLSLVLNYVPDAHGRGEMLKRITKFLRRTDEQSHNGTDAVLPVLFFVLPLPCVNNSRYLNEDMLLRIMNDLGFTMKYSKNTSKLCYYLFIWSSNPLPKTTPKRKIRDGAAMNNFCIIVE